MNCFNWTSLLIIAFGIYVAYKHSKLRHKFEPFNVSPARKIDKSVPKLIIKDDYEVLLHGKINGIESLAILDGTIYATDQNCDVLKVKDNKIVQRFPLIKDKKCDGCCSALGIRHWHGEKFVFVDGVLGVLVLDFKDESVQHIYPATNLLGKYTGMFADDFDFINNETIVFSDLTASCSMSELGACLYGAVKDSRLIQVNLKTREASVILDNQFGLNGVQTHSDKQSVLVAQSLMSRILRFYFDGPKKGKVEVFADGLPGLPDNIRLSSKGNTFWVAHFLSRPIEGRVVGQILGPYPWARSWLYSITQTICPHLFDLILNAGSTSHHIFVELDTNGKVVGVVHDPDGKFPFITQVTDDGSHLYLSSIGHDYVGKVKKILK